MRPQMRPSRFTPATEAVAKGVEYHIANARLLAERAVPSFVPGLRVANAIITEDVPTAAVDMFWRVYWNPHFVEFMMKSARAVSPTNPCPSCGATTHHELAYVAGTWVHEVGHRVFRHRERFEAMGYTPDQHGKWNEATDAEMDDDIPLLGKTAHEQAPEKEPLPAICLDKWMLVDVKKGQAANNSAEYWAAITVWDVNNKNKSLKKKPSCWFPDTIGQPEGWIAENYFEAMESPEDEEGDEGEGEGQGQGQGQGNPFPKMGGGGGGGTPQHNEHGSGVCGDQRPWEDGKPGENGNAPGTTEAEAQAVRRDVAEKIKEAKSKGRGHIPGGWEVFANEMLAAPKVRWQDRLRAVARQAITRVRGERQNTYRRLSRGSIVSGCQVIKPSTYNIVPTVVVVCDTSGSMGSGENSRLLSALSEAEAILKTNAVKGYFLDCDANVYGKAQDVRSIRQASVNGGGGTDMGAGFRAAVKQKTKPDIIVILTDGDTPWPSADEVRRSGAIVVTAIVHEHGTNNCPAYMNPIHVDCT